MKDKLFYNGSIITMEGGNSDVKPQAVLVRDGRIAYVGSLDAAQNYASSDVCYVDLKGMCLMPSFIDPHSHIVMSGQMSAYADLSECESFAELISEIRSYIKKHKIAGGQPVLGFGYDHNFMKENRHPDKTVLDQVSKNIPIMIMHVSGHLCCVNSAMLKLAGIAPHAPNPDGGIYGRMPDGKELNGYAEEAAMYPFQKMIKLPEESEMMEMMSKSQEAYLKNGVTTAQDGASGIKEIQILEKMAQGNKLKLDVIAYPVMGAEGTEIMRSKGDKYRNYQNRFKIGGYKLILDGSPQGRTAWMTKPYSGSDDGYCGYPWMTDASVVENVQQALQEGRQILAHCNGDAAGDQFLDAYEKGIQELKIKENLRPVMIHCQTARKDQLYRMAEIGMIASIFVGHVWYWGDVHRKNLGTVRGEYISPVRDAIECGLVVNFHQDTPVTKPDMLHSVWCAVNRISRSGKIIGADQRICTYDALKAVTINAAYEYFEEESKGSIKAGKRADLIILDRSPLGVNPMEIKNIQVMETIKDGITVFSRSK